MSIGKNIKRIRENAGMSQYDLAKKLNVSQAAVSQFENGKNPPKIDTLLKIASALHVDINNLLEDTGSPMLNALKESNSPLYEDFRKSHLLNSVDSIEAIDIELIKNFHKLNNIGQKRLLEYVDELLKIREYEKVNRN